MNPDLLNYAVAVIVETPIGIPLIRDPQKPKPHFWKFPGGRNEPGETPLKTAVRELQEETGIDLPPAQLKLVHQEVRAENDRKHSLFIFRARIDKEIKIREQGLHGESVKLFGWEEIKSLPDFFPNHRLLLAALDAGPMS